MQPISNRCTLAVMCAAYTIDWGNAAEWVGALGSVAAILSGFALARRETRQASMRDQRLKAMTEREDRVISFMLGVVVMARIDAIIVAVKSGKVLLRSDVDLLRRAVHTDLRQVEKFDPTRLKRLYLIRAFMALVGAIGALADHLDEWATILLSGDDAEIANIRAVAPVNIQTLRATVATNFRQFLDALEAIDGKYDDDGPIAPLAK